MFISLHIHNRPDNVSARRFLIVCDSSTFILVPAPCPQPAEQRSPSGYETPEVTLHALPYIEFSFHILIIFVF